MRATVREADPSTRRFIAECSGNLFAAFHATRGGFPIPGEYVRWEEDPCDMVLGESSGTMLVDQWILGLTHQAAQAFMRVPGK
jgi:hypothetical protein